MWFMSVFKSSGVSVLFIPLKVFKIPAGTQAEIAEFLSPQQLDKWAFVKWKKKHKPCNTGQSLCPIFQQAAHVVTSTNLLCGWKQASLEKMLQSLKNNKSL